VEEDKELLDQETQQLITEQLAQQDFHHQLQRQLELFHLIKVTVQELMAVLDQVHHHHLLRFLAEEEQAQMLPIHQ
jgi:hypothetical protein